MWKLTNNLFFLTSDFVRIYTNIPNLYNNVIFLPKPLYTMNTNIIL